METTVDIEAYVFLYKDELFITVEHPSRIHRSDLKLKDMWFTDLAKIQRIHDQVNNGKEYPKHPKYQIINVSLKVTIDE